MPRWFWKPILHGMILRLQPAKSAQLYREIWTDAGSPLIVHTYNLTKKVRTLLPNWEVAMAMTYGQPTIASQIAKLQQKCRHITVLPLFPHYSKSTTKSIIDQVAAVAPNATIIKRFGGDDAYIALLVNKINQLWTAGDYDQLFVSYHGVPVSMIKRGDPYQDETMVTLRKLQAALTLTSDKIKFTYQSRFGPTPWLQPYLHESLVQAADAGIRKVLLVCPSFTADCLETLHENGIENKANFLAHGGQTLDLVPALNDDAEFAQYIAHLVQIHK